jgi:hypothetical protein
MLPITTTHNIQSDISTKGYSLVLADEIPMTDEMRHAWETLREDYKSLPRDEYLPDNGLYRYRRYDRFYFYPATGELVLLLHQDYFQDTDINQVTGGIIRKFAPLTRETTNNPFLHELIRFDFANFPLEDPEMKYHAWQVDVHQIHVVANVGAAGHPTPEGVHRDGAEFVTVHIAALDNAAGGKVSIYDDDKNHLESFTLQNVLDSYLFNDALLWHGVTPITSKDGLNPAQRGILTFDYHYKPELTREV